MSTALICFGCRHTIQVDWVPFMDELSKEIGAYPFIWKYMFTDPKLFFALLFGACAPYQYRLTGKFDKFIVQNQVYKHPYHLLGPNKWSGAREAILTVQERIDAALQTNRGKAISTKAPSALATSMKNLNFFHFLIIFVVIALGFAVTLSTVLVSSIF